METAVDEKTIVARERLQLLVWGYYIHGGFNAFMFSLFLLPFIFMMAAFAAIPEAQWNNSSAKPAISNAVPANPPAVKSNQDAPPKIFFAIFGAVFGTIVLGNLAISALAIYAGRCIQKRARKTLIYIAAVVNCIFIPFGTLLGIFTIIVLGSPEGSAQFQSDRWDS